MYVNQEALHVTWYDLFIDMDGSARFVKTRGWMDLMQKGSTDSCVHYL